MTSINDQDKKGNSTENRTANRTKTRRRRSSRQRGGSRSKRGSNPVISAPYIKRKIPCYEMLDEEGISKIEDYAETILEEFGIQFRGDTKAIHMFVEAGAEVDKTNSEIVHFPKGLIKHLASTAPAQFTHHARNPEKSVVIGGDNLVLAPAYGSPFVRDLDNGRRYGNLDDFENFVKLAYVDPYIHHSGGTICEPVNVPVNKRHLDMVYAHMRYSDKVFLGSITSPERARDSISMAKILFGEDYVSKHCVIMGNINSTSPLLFDGDVSEVIRAYAEAGQGMIICPFVLGGAMGPVTPAGAVAQAHAESMVGVALTQLVRKGAPVIYGNFLTTLSLRSGSPTFGQPEATLAYFAIGQLARRAGIPLRCGGSFTSSKVNDFQAGQESADAMMPALMSGANFMLHSAGWLESGLVMGYEKFILDSNRMGMVTRIMKGLELDDNAFGLDSYRQRKEHNEHFLGTAHTMANYKTVFYESNTADSNAFEQWELDGSKTADQRANGIWKQRLKDYQRPPMDESIDEALKSFIQQKNESMPDMWY